jgi:hypothetical protein
MAREESDREDLLREATALVERIELAPAGDAGAEHIVVGFRAGGAASIFFGADPVYQFNVAGELRRAFCDGLLIKASRGRLVSLSRERLAAEVQLHSRELTQDEQSNFVANICDRLQELADGLDRDRFKIVGQAPANADVVGRVRKWLDEHDGRSIANSPRVGA